MGTEREQVVIPAHRMGKRAGQLSTRRARDDENNAATVLVTVDLSSPAATVALVGAKAANLAKAARASLPVLPGFAIPVPVVSRAVNAGGFADLTAAELDALHGAWRALTADDTVAVVARSSAVSEDAEDSSMAGRFTSVLAIRGWRAFLRALDDVAASASVVALDGSGRVERHAMAILVQQHLPAVYGGVLFGADPVSGRTDRFALATVRGGPEALVSGEVGGAQQVLTRRGRRLRTEGDASVAPPRRRVRELASLARQATAAFGGPQDIEWGVDASGRLWLLQSRPVTALGSGPATGPLLGPGPVAETFPDPLSRLEQELWLTPLRDGIVHAIDLTGVVPRKRLIESPVAVAVGGRAAVDLALIGAIGDPSRLVAKLDPRPGARRLRAAWRTGRMRRSLPELAKALLAAVDRDLRAVPPLSRAHDDELLAMLHGSRRALVALHGQEILAGLLVTADAAADVSGAATALASLQRARMRGTPEARIPAAHPEVLALVAPAIRPITIVPTDEYLALGAPPPRRQMNPDPITVARENLRMRIRWVQELTALAAWELGVRLAARGVVSEPSVVRDLDIAGLELALLGTRPLITPTEPAAPALPAMFRLDGVGRPIAASAGHAKAGQGAGGGRKAGRVVHDIADVNGDEPVVLVTQTLAPSLAAALPGLAGLVAETGSVLSHLAILARELGVPTVVGVEDARTRFEPGTNVVVDGATGSIERLDPIEVRER